MAHVKDFHSISFLFLARLPSLQAFCFRLALLVSYHPRQWLHLMVM